LIYLWNWLSDCFICPEVLTTKSCACQKHSDWWQNSTDVFNIITSVDKLATYTPVPLRKTLVKPSESN